MLGVQLRLGHMSGAQGGADRPKKLALCRLAEARGSGFRGSQYETEKWLRQVSPAVRAMKTVFSVEGATRCQNGVFS